MYCSQCFEKGFSEGKHANHRYLVTTIMMGCCDCGDINVLEPEGFCQNHKGYLKIDQKIDQGIVNRL